MKTEATGADRTEATRAYIPNNPSEPRKLVYIELGERYRLKLLRFLTLLQTRWAEMRDRSAAPKHRNL